MIRRGKEEHLNISLDEMPVVAFPGARQVEENTLVSVCFTTRVLDNRAT